MTATAETPTPTPPSGPPRQPTTDPGEQRSAIARLAMIVLAGVVAAVLTGVTKTVLVIVAIIVMIMLHELGHFMTAKWADMKVTEYFLGFGPRLWSVRRGETEYGVKAIPAGGYVKIIGMNNLEEVAPEDELRTYRQKPYWRRMSVAVAGSTVHFIIAFVLLYSLNLAYGAVKPELKVRSLSVIQGQSSPAQEAGFEKGDQIVSVDGRKFTSVDDLRTYIQRHAGEPITFVVNRSGALATLTPTPLNLATGIQIAAAEHPTTFALLQTADSCGFVGVEFDHTTEKPGTVSAAGKSASDFGHIASGTVGALGHLVTLQGVQGYANQLTGDSANAKSTCHTIATGAPGGGDNRFLSPIGLVRVANDAAKTGLADVLSLLVLINIFVGIFNMVPLLPLDGGHVAIATYEKIRSLLQGGKRYYADITKMMPIVYGVFLMLVFLGVSSLYLDIVRPVQLH